MGYDYGFHLVLVQPPKEVAIAAVKFMEETDQQGDFPIEVYAKQVAEFCKEYCRHQDNTPGFSEAQGYWFPTFGEEFHAGGKSYSCGDQDDGLKKSMEIIGKKFPDAVFALHHYYWDLTHLTVYTFQGDRILNETFIDFENFKVGPYTTCIHVDFLKVAIEGSMTMFFNDEYYYDEFDFKYERIYEIAGLPIPPPKPLYPIVFTINPPTSTETLVPQGSYVTL
jgi:hypothetical protein